MNPSDQTLAFLEFVESQPRQSVTSLLHNVLLRSRQMTGAEAGAAFLVKHKGRQSWLEPASVQNDRVRPRPGQRAMPVIPSSIIGYVADTGEIVAEPDVYAIGPKRPYRWHSGDETPGYRTRSLLCFPLKNYQDRVIGVVALTNRRKQGAGQPVAFGPEQAQLMVPILRALANHLERAEMLEKIRDRNAKLRLRNRELAERRSQVEALQAETEDAFMLSITLLARAAEIYDAETGNHIARVNEYSYFLAMELGQSQAFAEEIRYSAQLHDVGKISVNSAVLKKRGKLTAAERHEMDLHPLYGYRILEPSPRLRMAAEIALYHHEKWDGSGYPQGTRGEAIPIAARIVALADVYDALRASRPYKPAYAHEDAVRILLHGDRRIDPAGHFDPQLLALFERRHDGFSEIFERLGD